MMLEDSEKLNVSLERGLTSPLFSRDESVCSHALALPLSRKNRTLTFEVFVR